MEDNKIDKIIKNLSVISLVVFLLSTVLIGIVLIGNTFFGINSTRSPEILLMLLWVFFIIFYLIYFILFLINYPYRSSGMKEQKERNKTKEKLLSIAGLILFWSFLAIAILVGLMIVASLVLVIPDMLPLEIVVRNLGSLVAIFIIQLITMWIINESMKNFDRKKAQAKMDHERRKMMQLEKQIPRSVKTAQEYLIQSYHKGYYQGKLSEDEFRKHLGQLNDEQMIDDFFKVSKRQTLVTLNLYAKK